MSVTMDENIKRWTAKRKTALVIEIIQGKTTVAEANRSFDLSPSEVEGWVDDAKRGMGNSLRAKAMRDLAKIEKKIASILAAIEDGMYHPSMKEKMAALEAEKSGISRFLDTSPEPPALRLHPRMSDLSREKIADLAEALNQPELKSQATELLRGLISDVRMVPTPGVPGGHEIELIGELAGVLNLAEPDMTKPPRMQGLGSETMVAGARSANCFAMTRAIIPPSYKVAA